MAEIVLGMWTSHGPTLSTTAEQWTMRVPADKANKHHPFRGKTYDFDQLVELRRDENLAAQCTFEERKKRKAGCDRGIARMADKFAEVSPDVAVIFGNDQNELFMEDVMPAMTVFWGDTIWDQPASEEQAARMPPGIHVAEAGHSPPEYREYPGLPDLGLAIIKSAIVNGFDVAQSTTLPKPEGHWAHGVPHAFGFIYRQIMRDKVIPNVPIIFNTFFPPNQPTAKRCFEFGKMVAKAIKDWDSDKRVAVFGSGGMSHFVIDEDFDRMFFEALRNRDAATLTSIDDKYFQSGTSELKNWVTAAGALFGTDLDGDMVEYQACYRSEAGTGTANGFVYWI
jgi:Catalytic LigB subunit of aromatic ring-opening dioxygenase